jgi:hypothetical protein
MFRYPIFLAWIVSFLLVDFILLCPLSKNILHSLHCSNYCYYYYHYFIFIMMYLERHFHYYVRNHAFHIAFFLKCLHNARPFDGSDSIKCLPNRPHNFKKLYVMISLNNRFEVLLPTSLFPMFYMLAYPKFLSSTVLFEFVLFILKCLDIQSF